MCLVSAPRSQFAARRHQAHSTSIDLSLPPPTSLQVLTLAIGGDEYALLSFAIPQPDVPAGLTPAEREVVRGVVRGESNCEIARVRGVSPNTVANQLRAVYAKLGVGSRHELVTRCMRPSPALGPSKLPF